MPIFEYKCLDCEHHYDILHLSKEKLEDIVCPSCSSSRAKKLISTFSASTDGVDFSSSKSESLNPPPTCSTGSCCFN